MESSIAKVLLCEIEELSNELKYMTGDKPLLDEHITHLESEIEEISNQIRLHETEQSALIVANESIKQTKIKKNMQH